MLTVIIGHGDRATKGLMILLLEELPELELLDTTEEIYSFLKFFMYCLFLIVLTGYNRNGSTQRSLLA